MRCQGLAIGYELSAVSHQIPASKLVADSGDKC